MQTGEHAEVETKETEFQVCRLDCSGCTEVISLQETLHVVQLELKTLPPLAFLLSTEWIFSVKNNFVFIKQNFIEIYVNHELNCLFTIGLLEMKRVPAFNMA